MKRLIFSLLASVLLVLPVVAQRVEAVDGAEIKLTNYVTSWIGNDGGYEEVHIPTTCGTCM